MVRSHRLRKVGWNCGFYYWNLGNITCRPRQSIIIESALVLNYRSTENICINVTICHCKLLNCNPTTMYQASLITCNPPLSATGKFAQMMTSWHLNTPRYWTFVSPVVFPMMRDFDVLFVVGRRSNESSRYCVSWLFWPKYDQQLPFCMLWYPNV